MVKIIFVSASSLISRRDVDRFGFQILQRRGAEVEHWNLSPLANDRKHLASVSDPIDSYTRCFDSFDELTVATRELNEEDFIVCVGLTGSLSKIRLLMALRVLSQSAASFTALAVGYNPRHHLLAREKGRKSLKDRLSVKRLRNVESYALRMLNLNSLSLFLRAVLGIRPLDHVWSGVSLAAHVYPGLVSRQTKIHWIHNLDFDRYLELGDASEQLVEGAYAVVIGSMGPLHPDLRLDSLGDRLATEEDWRVIAERAFSFIQDYLDSRIIIAGHPRSNQLLNSRLFPGQTVIHGDTAKLIRDADFVIDYMGSTAVGYAVMFETPLITLLCPGLATVDQRKAAEISSRLTGSLVIDLESEAVFSSVPQVNRELYRRYRETYIKRSGTSRGRFFWDQVADLMELPNS